MTERNDKIVQEIISDPTLVQELCALTGDLTLAFAHSRIRTLQLEMKEFVKLVSELRQENRALRQDLDGVARKAKKLQDVLLNRIKALEAQANGCGPGKSD